MSTMYTLIQASLASDNQNIRNEAEAAITHYSESLPGFCSSLMEVIVSRDLESQVDIRLTASVHLKNCVIRCWRNKGGMKISNEEKMHLKKKLMSHLGEKNTQIARMLAVIISKIARFEYPNDWPTLFMNLMQELPSADAITFHRIFLILFRTLKELSTKRLVLDQKVFEEVSVHLFDHILSYWKNDTHQIFSGLLSTSQDSKSNDSDQCFDDFLLLWDRWFLCTKAIGLLIVFGFPSDQKNLQGVRAVKEACPIFLNAVQSFIPYFFSPHPKFWVHVEKSSIKLMKVLIAIQDIHPYSFSNTCVLPHVMDFCFSKLVETDPDLIQCKKFLIKCMVMLKSILQCNVYKKSLTGRVLDDNAPTFEKMKKTASSNAYSIIASVMSHERIVNLCNILIRRYFILANSDLMERVQNPEVFHHEQDMVQWHEKLRPCAEALYIVLFENYSHFLGSVVVSILEEAVDECRAVTNQVTRSLLLKEAAYNATVHVSHELSNYFNFRDWFNGTLSFEIMSQHPFANLIRRPIALILGQWISEIKDDTRKSVYHALIKLLQEEDLSVRMAACRSLFLHIEDPSFSEESFSDLFHICWNLCFKLFQDAQQFDSKAQVMNSISVLVERVSDITPFADLLMGFFKVVWKESLGESILRIQLLVALRNFVTTLGFRSPFSYSIIIPILEYGLDINNPDEINLLEDSMLLWEATISNAPSLVPQLVALFSFLVPITEKNFDYIQVSITIIEDYIIIGENEFFSMHASNVVKILDIMVGNVNDKGLLSLLPVIELLIQCFGEHVIVMIRSPLEILVSICLTRPDDNDPSKTNLKASCAAIMAIILVHNTDFLLQLASQQSLFLLLQKSGFPVEKNVLLCLIDIWLDKIDYVPFIQRKAYCLALSITLTINSHQVLDKLDLILSACTSVILYGKDCLNEEVSGCNDGDFSNKEKRKKLILSSDYINGCSLENVVRENLQKCSSIHGDAFNDVINAMHPSALTQLKQALCIS